MGYCHFPIVVLLPSTSISFNRSCSHYYYCHLQVGSVLFLWVSEMMTNALKTTLLHGMKNINYLERVESLSALFRIC